MKKLCLLITVILLLSFSSDGLAGVKYRIYKNNKIDKVLKYQAKIQKHYTENHVNGTPWITSFPVKTYDDKYAVPLVGEGYPENDGDDGVVDSIEPPAAE
jgi:hypothetical protein